MPVDTQAVATTAIALAGAGFGLYAMRKRRSSAEASEARLAAQEKELLALREKVAAQVSQEVELKVLREQIQQVSTSGFSTHGLAKGEVRGIDAMNQALWRMGALKHQPPSFKYFDPSLEEQKTVLMKEIKLPRAAQTHELCYEPKTRCLFISQMSNSVLVRIPVGPDGMLCDDQDAWNVGPVHPKTGEGVSGLHNISRSPHNPGCLWLSLQFQNTLLLLDAATMGVRQVIKCPQLLTRKDGSVLRVGGPHCVRECGQTGSLWVALKGSVPCHPQTTGSSQKSLAAAVSRVCCNPQAIKERIEAAKGLDGEAGGGGGEALEAIPEGFAVWRINPKRYDPKADMYGGTLFECEPSPPMLSITRDCNCYVAQDKAPAIARIDTKADKIEQLPIALPRPTDDQDDPNYPGYELQMTGPAIATAPDGAVWCSLLGGVGSLVRIDPVTGGKIRYELGNGSGEWMRSCRIIHLIFHQGERWFIFNGHKVRQPKANMLYLISSNLVDPEAINAITCIDFNVHVGSGWTAMSMRKEIALPTQNCCCHRIEIISDALTGHAHETVVVSELSESRIFQIQLYHIEVQDYLSEEHSVTPCGTTVLRYVPAGSNSKYSRCEEDKAQFMCALRRFVAETPREPDGSIRYPTRGDTPDDYPEEARPAVAQLLTFLKRARKMRNAKGGEECFFHQCHHEHNVGCAHAQETRKREAQYFQHMHVADPLSVADMLKGGDKGEAESASARRSSNLGLSLMSRFAMAAKNGRA